MNKKVISTAMAAITMLGTSPFTAMANYETTLAYEQRRSENYNESADETHPLLIEFFSNLDNSNLPMVHTTFYLGEGIYVDVIPHLARRTVTTIRMIMLMTQPVVGNWILPALPTGQLLNISHSVVAHQDRSTWHFVSTSTDQGNRQGWVNSLDVR